MSAQKIVRVRDVMTENFKIVDGLGTVQQGLVQMKASPVRTLIIDKRDDDDEYGIVLLSDIAKKVLAKDRSPARVSLHEIMTKPVVWVEPRMNVRYCARLFHKLGLSIAPVLEQDKIVGVVSYHEIVLNGLIELL